jgi:hypothetical protein
MDWRAPPMLPSAVEVGLTLWGEEDRQALCGGTVTDCVFLHFWMALCPGSWLGGCGSVADMHQGAMHQCAKHVNVYSVSTPLVCIHWCVCKCIHSSGVCYVKG